jgi:hypothetical protein
MCVLVCDPISSPDFSKDGCLDSPDECIGDVGFVKCGDDECVHICDFECPANSDFSTALTRTIRTNASPFAFPLTANKLPLIHFTNSPTAAIAGHYLRSAVPSLFGGVLVMHVCDDPGGSTPPLGGCAESQIQALRNATIAADL